MESSPSWPMAPAWKAGGLTLTRVRIPHSPPKFKMADVTYNTIFKIESGCSQNPAIDTLSKIAKALDVGVDEIIK